MTMRRVVCVTCDAALLSVVGCGGSPENDTPIGAADAAGAEPSGEASAEQVAREMRGDVKCPARASNPRPEGAAVDDVVGVRPGMSWNEAATFVLCDNPMMVVAETPAATTRSTHTARSCARASTAPSPGLARS